MELPLLPLEAIAGREPVLRLRHSITNTNYYVQVFAESARGVEPALDAAQDSALGLPPHGTRIESSSEVEGMEDDRLFVADPLEPTQDDTLLSALPSAAREWVAAGRLMYLPLTGLTRKSLQRLGVMAVPKVQIG
jgi:A/G-specific adenine glycosylase